ncbi:stalk domain-containing protein [Caldalkalibacillus salinus]|uniref:stalk domain-containing protein n=1 Tax=Caldalkalibacillus salinus TaxID=2803787 RepID=UPI001F3623FD|nr:stalk domain-containing protein [Caldalkalibacillus salinus]
MTLTSQPRIRPKALSVITLIASLALICIFIPFTDTEVSAAEQTSVKVDGQAVVFPDTQPTVSQGRTLVPLRPIVEAMGADVQWDSDNRVAHIAMEGQAELSVPVDYQYVQLDTQGESAAIKIDVPAQVLHGRTMVPLRVIGESLGYRVNWDSQTSTAAYVKTDETQQTFQSYTVDGDIEKLHPYELDVFWSVNEKRASASVQPLALHVDLSLVAREKSKDMLDNGYFDHTSPTYGTPFEMMTEFNLSYRAAGENIAAGQRSPEEVMNGWMNSPGHRQNIESESFTHIGVGFVSGSTGYRNYWTQMFMTP